MVGLKNIREAAGRIRAVIRPTPRIHSYGLSRHGGCPVWYDTPRCPPLCGPPVISGQGTIGPEILSECSGLGTLLVPVGGGGLISGITTAVRSA